MKCLNDFFLIHYVKMWYVMLNTWKNLKYLKNAQYEGECVICV